MSAMTAGCSRSGVCVDEDSDLCIRKSAASESSRDSADRWLNTITRGHLDDWRAIARMPFAYLRKQREAEERQRQGRDGSQAASVSSYRAIKIGLLAVLIVPVLLQLPWLHGAFGPGTRMPAFWVRSSPHGSAQCANVPGDEHFRFCEDLEHIPRTDEGPETVLISCDSGRAKWNTVMGPLEAPEPRGKLFTYEYATSSYAKVKEAVPVELVDFPPESTFHPLGMSILPSTAADGGRGSTLMVVNHRRESSSVELFHLLPPAGDRGWTAEWKRSIVHPLATHTPNSIHALTSSSFLVTNDHFFARRPGPWDTHLLPLLQCVFPQTVPKWALEKMAKLLSVGWVAARLAQTETILGLPLGWVSYVSFDRDADETRGVEARIIAKAIPFANGLAVSPDEKTLIVAATTYPGVFIYDVLPASSHRVKWNLGQLTKLHLPFRVDNLAFSTPLHTSSSRGRFNNLTLLATGHPAPFKLIAMSRDPLAKISPTWSVAITPFQSAQDSNRLVWEDNDAPLPAHRFSLSQNPQWSIRSLLQTTGETILRNDGSKLSLPSGASSFLHAETLLVSGLYGPVLVCTNVST